jgi:hypothetical protein
VLAPYERGLVGSLDTGELRRALAINVELYLNEVTDHDPELAQRLQAPLQEAVDDVTEANAS